MTAVEKIIEEIEQELQEREGCNGALNSGVVLGLTNAKKFALKYLEMEKEQIVEAFVTSRDPYGISVGNSHSIKKAEQYYNETFKSE